MALPTYEVARILAKATAAARRQLPVIQFVRFWRPRPDISWRTYGYENHIKWHVTGPLPRIKASPELKPLPMVPFVRKNQWTENKAAFGQNDYIDILGDGSLHPRDLLKGPNWLRGFKGTEMQRLIRKRNYSLHWLPQVWPTQWHDMQKRIWYLYKYHNQKQNHKDMKNLFERPAHKWDFK